MQKPIALFAVLALTGALPCQIRARQPAAPPPSPRQLPPPRIPIVPPPVDMPVYLGQPGMQQSDAASTGADPQPKGGSAPAVAPAEARARAFLERRIKGKDLKQNVERVVKELHWHERLDEATAAAAATGKPVLWVQALGDIDGFA